MFGNMIGIILIEIFGRITVHSSFENTNEKEKLTAIINVR